MPPENGLRYGAVEISRCPAGKIITGEPNNTEDSPNGRAAVQKTDMRETFWGFESSIFRQIPQAGIEAREAKYRRASADLDGW